MYSLTVKKRNTGKICSDCEILFGFMQGVCTFYFEGLLMFLMNTQQGGYVRIKSLIIIIIIIKGSGSDTIGNYSKYLLA